MPISGTEERLEYHRKWNSRNKEKLRAAKDRYHARHPGRERELAKIRYQKRREREREASSASAHQRKVFGKMPGFERALEFYEDRASVVCQACSSKEPGSPKGWNFDHCHKTLRVRGILCLHCNSALGMVKDSIPRLEALIAYLKDPPALRSTPQHPVETSALTLAS